MSMNDFKVIEKEFRKRKCCKNDEKRNQKLKDLNWQ